MRIVTLLLLTALINGTFLTGCAGLRVQHHTRFQPTTLNQSTDPLWESVFAVLAGSSLHVELRSGDRIRGRFRSADEQTLILVQGRDIRSVPRAEIQRVAIIRGTDAGTGALWGLGIGGVIMFLTANDDDFTIAGRFFWPLSAEA